MSNFASFHSLYSSTCAEYHLSALANGALLATAPVNRALPNAPDGYTPQGETCPSKRPSIRNATALSSAETSWLKARRNNTKDALKAFLSRVDLGSFNGSDYIANHSANASALPNIGIAVSGGGYRALMNGGGALQAFDNRTTNSTHSGQLGGILQSATYLSGLSGGSWLVGSIYMNNFSDVSSLQDNGSVWQFQDSIFSGPTQSTTWDIGTVEYYSQLLGAVDGKSNAGYEVSITDYWYVFCSPAPWREKGILTIHTGDVLSLTSSSTRPKVASVIPGRRLL